MRASAKSARRATTKPARAGTIRCGAVQKMNAEELEIAMANRDRPMVIDFYATWCGPCKLASEMCGKFASQTEFKDKVKFVKIDTEKYVELSSKWKVEGLPTFVLFHKGKVLDRIEGLPTEQQMKDRLLYFLQQV